MGDNKNQAPLFIIIFEDGSNFRGGISNYETRWKDIPFRKIIRVYYLLPSGDYLCLEGYDKYNRMVEVTQDWMRMSKKAKKLSDKPVLEYLYFMGLKGDTVTSYRIALRGEKGKDKFMKGDVTVRQYPLGQEWYGKPTTGWVGGILWEKSKTSPNKK